jgi:hypothetical protein
VGDSYVWSSQFRDDLPCVFCGRTERTVLTMSRPDVRQGLCEACCVNAAWSWRGLPGDSPALPAKVARPTRIKVLIPRLQKSASGAASPSPDLPISYEFALVKVPPNLAVEPAEKIVISPEPQESTALPDRDDVTRVSQINDLPGAKLGENEDEVAAVERALGSIGVGTWPMFCEPLYAGYTPRGSFARVYLVTAWYRRTSADGLSFLPQEGLVWRPGPVHDSTPEMAGLYLALREVWPLRVWKHAARTAKLSAVSVQLSRGAVEYVRMQAAIRAADREVDTSMAEILYKRMTADEKAVEKLIGAEAATRADLNAQLEAERRVADVAAQVEAATDAGDDSFDESPDNLSDAVDDAVSPPVMTGINRSRPAGEDPDE